MEVRTASADGNGKVEVEVYVEAFCKFSAEFVSHSLGPTLKAEGVADIVDLKFSQCGHCRVDKNQDGGFECQHGAAECAANKMIACGVDAAAPSGALAIAKYTSCMYSLPKGWMVDAGYNRQCAELVDLDQAAVYQCGTGEEGNEKLMDHYKMSEKAGVSGPESSALSNTGDSKIEPSRTLQEPSDLGTDGKDGSSKRHPVPWVIVDDKVLDDPSKIREAICQAQEARGGHIPDGCHIALAPTIESQAPTQAEVNEETDESKKDGAKEDNEPVKESGGVTDDAPAATTSEPDVAQGKDASPAKSAAPVDEKAVKDEVQKMIDAELKAEAKERKAKERAMTEKVKAKIDLYKESKDQDLEAKIAAFVKSRAHADQSAGMEAQEEDSEEASAETDTDNSKRSQEVAAEDGSMSPKERRVAARKAARIEAAEANRVEENKDSQGRQGTAAVVAALGARRLGGGFKQLHQRRIGNAMKSGVFSEALKQAALGESGGHGFGATHFANLGNSQFASLGEAMEAVPERSLAAEDGVYGPFNYKLSRGFGSI